MLKMAQGGKGKQMAASPSQAKNFIWPTAAGGLSAAPNGRKPTYYQPQ